MKKYIVGVLFIVVLTLSLCACGETENGTEHSNDTSLNVEAGSIELTIPDDYEYSEDSDEGTVIYVAYNSDGEVSKAILISSLEAIDNIDADLEEIREQAKAYAKELDGTEDGELIKLQTEKKTIIEEGYPLIICSCENANHEYVKDYFYFFEDCTGVILEINYEKRDFSDIDQVIKDAYFDLEERYDDYYDDEDYDDYDYDEPSVTVGQENALRSAEDYLSMSTGFSEKSLRDQLEYEGYESEDIDWALENVDVDWKEQCEKSAKSYMESQSFSADGLRNQLSYEGFTDDQIEAGLAAVGY